MSDIYPSMRQDSTIQALPRNGPTRQL